MTTVHHMSMAATELGSVALLLLFVATAHGLPKVSVGDPLQSIQGLVSRVLGEKYVSQFVYQVIPPDPVSGHDVFEIDYDGSASKPILRGNNGVALASALNNFLKYDCGCSVSWGRDGSGDQLDLPQPLPMPATRKVVFPVRFR